MTKNDYHYSDKNIRVLSGVEAVRKRPAMYIGYTGKFGLQQMVFLTVFEFLKAKDKLIEVKIQIKAADRVQIVAEFKESLDFKVAEFTELCTKKIVTEKTTFTVFNALSQFYKIELTQNKSIFLQEFMQGEKVATSKKDTTADKTSIKINFVPDSLIFTNDPIRFDAEAIREQLNVYAYLNSKICFKLEAENKQQSYCYLEGLSSYLSESTVNKETAFARPFALSAKQGQVAFDLAFQYSLNEESSMLVYVNQEYNCKAGTPALGFKLCLNRKLFQFALENQLVTEEDSFIHFDSSKGLQAIISVTHPYPQYRGAVKDEIQNEDCAELIDFYLDSMLDSWLIENRQEFIQLIQQLSNKNLENQC